MAGFLSRLFGGGPKRNKAELFIEDKMQTLINKTGLKLSFDLKVSEDQKRILIDLYGEDEALAKDRDAQLLDAFQLFLKRTSQNQFPEEKMSIIVDCDSYREQSDDDLIKIAEKLKGMVLKKKKPAFFRALPPRERKIIHQYLSEDKRFRTKSVGDGMYKKIKISLAGDKSPNTNSNPNAKPRNNDKKNFNKLNDSKNNKKESSAADVDKNSDVDLVDESIEQDILSTDV